MRLLQKAHAYPTRERQRHLTEHTADVGALPKARATQNHQLHAHPMTRLADLPKTLALTLCLLSAAGVCTDEARAGTREAMAEAMSRMMEAMGLFDPGAMTSMPMGAPFGAPGSAPGVGGFGMPGASPWNIPLQDPSGAMEKGGEMMQQFSKGMGMPGDAGAQMFPWSSGSRLEGIWEGRNGELLIVQGNRFRIYPGRAGYLEGYLKMSGERLAMYSPEDANIRPFEYAESDGRLVLRDGTGQLYLYRRLWVDEQRPPQTQASPDK